LNFCGVGCNLVAGILSPESFLIDTLSLRMNFGVASVSG
jgi:hypothetical protein